MIRFSVSSFTKLLLKDRGKIAVVKNGETALIVDFVLKNSVAVGELLSSGETICWNTEGTCLTKENSDYNVVGVLEHECKGKRSSNMRQGNVSKLYGSCTQSSNSL